jgi:hypothetical protein
MMNLHFFLPPMISFRKYIDRHWYGGRYALASTVRRLKISRFDLYLAAKAYAEMRWLDYIIL